MREFFWKRGYVNIVLIGYRCSGKTVVGKIIAHTRARDFYDTDVLIEKNAGRPIASIISRDGWAYFRETERQVVAAVAEKKEATIAVDTSNLSAVEVASSIMESLSEEFGG